MYHYLEKERLQLLFPEEISISQIINLFTNQLLLYSRKMVIIMFKKVSFLSQKKKKKRVFHLTFLLYQLNSSISFSSILFDLLDNAVSNLHTNSSIIQQQIIRNKACEEIRV